MYYTVNILYKSERSDGQPSLWEESVVLISADNEVEAEEKAVTLAKNNETNFEVAVNSEVIWKFSQIERVYCIDDGLKDGVELFSRFLRGSEVESILTPFSD